MKRLLAISDILLLVGAGCPIICDESVPMFSVYDSKSKTTKNFGRSFDDAEQYLKQNEGYIVTGSACKGGY